MPLDIDTLVYINYTAKIKDGDIIEITDEEEAKKLNVYDPAQKYEPKLVAIGDGWVLKGVDEILKTIEVGERIKFEVPPEKGFGLRDPNKVKLIPLRKFGEKASELRIDNEVEIDNKIGIVRFIGSGRAQIDFNHKLASKTIIYDLEILKKIETDEDKILALITRRLPLEEKMIIFNLKEENIEIQLPQDIYLLDGIQIIKRAISNDIFRFITKINKVYFLEIYENKKITEISNLKQDKNQDV